MRAKFRLCWQTQQLGLLLECFLTVQGARSISFGRWWLDWELKEEEAVGARNILACGLSSLWSLFSNRPSLQKDSIRWWGELYHPVPSSRGRTQKMSVCPHQTPTSLPRVFLCLTFHCRSSSGLEARSPTCPYPTHLCSLGFVFRSGRPGTQTFFSKRCFYQLTLLSTLYLQRMEICRQMQIQTNTLSSISPYSVS